MVEDCTAAWPESAHQTALETHRSVFGLVASAAEIHRAWEAVRSAR
jgi:hypothetical protein